MHHLLATPTENRQESNDRDSANRLSSQSLDNGLQIERICVPDADVEPTQAGIEHMLSEWAEVGRAILFRRKQGHEALQEKE